MISNRPTIAAHLWGMAAQDQELRFVAALERVSKSYIGKRGQL